MIKLKFKELVKKIDKPITQIAEETGINRNTLSALAGEQVNGIKFSTLNKICQTYNFNVEDLITFVREKQPAHPRRIYRQEAESAVITMMAPATASATEYQMPDGTRVGFGALTGYYKDGYSFWYWDYDALKKLSQAFIKNYSDPVRLENFYYEFSKYASEIEDIYRNTPEENIVSLTDKELIKHFDKLWKLFREFWRTSLFIDSFDVGTDQEEINRLAKKHELDLDEVGLLTTPVEMPFSYEKELALLRIIKSLKPEQQKITDGFLKTFVSTSPEIARYKQDFDYCGSNYATVKHLTSSEVIREIKKYLNDPDQFEVELERLEKYSEVQQKKIQGVLKKHGLQSNPLFLFNKLTYWRERRKQVNLMCFHLVDAILLSLESKTGINKKLLKQLSHTEIENVLAGMVERSLLEKRLKGPMIFHILGHNYKMILGQEADSIREEIEERISNDSENSNLIPGQVASRGYAKGSARLVIGEKDFGKFKDGEVLVTGMTRPEFVPLMKRACAIVTNEGGITCHAAIVSRELGKPCIIGTKNATEIIKDGDLIEVRANHGTVRILR